MKTIFNMCFFILLCALVVQAQWVQTNGPNSKRVTSFALSGTNLFAGTDGSHVYLSTNNGADWTAVNNGLTNSYVNALITSGTNLFAGTNGSGVYLSTDNGANWTAVNNGLTDSFVYALFTSGENLFTGTRIGVFRRPLSEMITAVEGEKKNIPKEFVIEQNYPNPFNPTTSISYTLPEEGRVQIKVFDALGRELTTLLDDVVSSGKHTIDWNGSNSASGIYFYSISFKGQMLYKKMLLVK
jgi:hypothetical protein